MCAAEHAAGEARPGYGQGAFPSGSAESYTVEDYAKSKCLNAQWLREHFGLRDGTWHGHPCVMMPWRDKDGATFRWRVRRAPDPETGKKRVVWGSVGPAYIDGDGMGYKAYKDATKDIPNTMLPPYGIEHVAPDTDFVIVGEGESDGQALDLMGLPYLGVAGASTYSETTERYVTNVLCSPTIYVVDEGDEGAATLIRKVAQTHGPDFKLISCRSVEMPDGGTAKDPSDVLIACGGDFSRAADEMLRIIGEAVPYGIDVSKSRFELGGITGVSGAEAIRHGTEDGEPPALIDGLLACGGKMVIAAPSKNFKSWAALELAVMLSVGGRWLGHRCKRSRVVYLDYENGSRTTNNRLSRVGRALLSRDGHKTVSPEYDGDLDSNLTVFDMLGEGSDTDTLTANVIEYIRRMEACGTHVDTLIIDPIYKASTADENDNAEVQKALRPFDSVRKLGTATIYSAHYKKGWRSVPVEERISGASSFVRDYTAAVFFSPDANGRGSMGDSSIGRWVSAHEGQPSMYDTIEHARRGCIRGFSVAFDTRDYRSPSDGACYVEGIAEGIPHHVMVPDGLLDGAADEKPQQAGADAVKDKAREAWSIINAEIAQAVLETQTTDDGGKVTRYPTAGEVYDHMDWLNITETTDRPQPDESHFRGAKWLKNAMCEWRIDDTSGRGRRATVVPR